MAKITYTVINRPKKDSKGRTDIGWKAENGKEAVTVGGYLETSRTAPSEVRQYHAVMIKDGMRTSVGNTHETRAQAAFAIWRAYYADVRNEREIEKMRLQEEKERRAKEREKVRAFRVTPEGQKAYREELNRKAKERRDAMTADQKSAIYSKRKAKRAHEREYGG